MLVAEANQWREAILPNRMEQLSHLGPVRYPSQPSNGLDTDAAVCSTFRNELECSRASWMRCSGEAVERSRDMHFGWSVLITG